MAQMKRRSRSTELHFTQREVRHVVCLLFLNPKYPGKQGQIDAEEWTQTNKRLSEKFGKIDFRFPQEEARRRK